MECATIEDLALSSGLGIHELVGQQASLEEAFMELTADAVDYRIGERMAEPAGKGA